MFSEDEPGDPVWHRLTLDHGEVAERGNNV